MHHRLLIRIHPHGETWPVHFGRPDHEGPLWSDAPLADCTEVGLMVKRGLHNVAQVRLVPINADGWAVPGSEVVLLITLTAPATVCGPEAVVEGEITPSALNIERLEAMEAARPGILAALGITGVVGAAA